VCASTDRWAGQPVDVSPARPKNQMLIFVSDWSASACYVGCGAETCFNTIETWVLPHNHKPG